jgi:glutamate synthase domain-containing protein 2/glutamate synthase domain-containing protein 1/glutamate synthase domain-containing protein 3
MSPSQRAFGLYSPDFEHDACGVGFVADISGRPSHAILRQAIRAVINLTHRGAVDADAKTGDGAGVLTQLPRKLLLREAERLGWRIDSAEDLGVAMVFLPGRDAGAQRRSRELIERTAAEHGLKPLGWRRVPVRPEELGDKARETQPEIAQLFVLRPQGLDGERFERKLYLARKVIEKRALAEGLADLYLPSFSHRTIVYKALVVAPQLERFYLDLLDPDFTTALAVFHQRYSTNTFPTWPLAQPMRLLAHNGEINTLKGNRNWMKAREPEMRSEVWGAEIEKLKPVITEGGSDSTSLDNALELLTLSGRSVLHAMMMLVPEAYQRMPRMDPELRSLYEYLSCISEPWDGPAALAFSDGIVVGALLDRNGLRPARYKITEGGTIVMASEVGVLEIPDEDVVEKGRLGPGHMIAVDTARGELLRNFEIKKEIARRKPYGEWLKRNLYRVDPARFDREPRPTMEPVELVRHQKAFGYAEEELEVILSPMITEAKEPVGSMGDDTPLSVLSKRPRLLYSYFKQLFAQVTNPPIDSLREELVMSLNTALGHRRSLLEETPEHARLIKFSSPILNAAEMEWLKGLPEGLDDERKGHFKSATLPTLFPAAEGAAGLERALERLCEAAVEAVDGGANILVLSDRGVSAEAAPIPMLLAVGAVHHHLIRQGRRMRASLVVETGEAREEHHFACLLGYGASMIHPYVTYETILHLLGNGENGFEGLDARRALANYKKAIEHGILKIMSKMGISTLSSYRGAQIFEAVGLDREIVDRYFTGTPSRIDGAGLEDIADEVLRFHRAAFGVPKPRLEQEGYYRYRKTGEYHAFNPDVFKAIHRMVKSGSPEDYARYAKAADERPPTAIRDLLDFVPGTPVPLEEVEPVEEILRRFTTGSISHGALGREAHETLAIAMNRIGAKSGSGEGGEDPARYRRRPDGDSANSAIKQVASARFGVTPEYLASALELEIKMAQGSKPGEGGQLPGHKVSVEIAAIRHSVPGVTLISPPPHHDIYSIEDLAQLIYDLKQANPRAKVAVKLVAEVGVGTIAAGVAKAYADVIQISGHDGGTGASPVGSIKNAGMPWEIGLAETQQVLILNHLRERVVLRTDGGLRTARDVVIAALLGAEQYGFGTAAIVAMGCVMARQCHLNTCPVGVATQKPELRAKFPGKPEMVVNFFTLIAQEVRRILARLGFRRMDEIIGRVDLLRLKRVEDPSKALKLDLRPILAAPDPTWTLPRRCLWERNDRKDDRPLDLQILEDAREALDGKGPVKLFYKIRNVHRAVGTRVAGEIAYRYGDAGLKPGTIHCVFEGSAGQSFGAFSIRGLRLELEGEANDYVGKGLGGGEIVIRPGRGAKFRSHENVIVGNTVLYGATSGFFYAAGRAGERFAVRNSGAIAVIEGVGDHGCEYMTGGLVVVLGETGRNFGAGMTGGAAYVLDEAEDFPLRYNPQLVGLERVERGEDRELLASLILRHRELTGSARAAEILERWDRYLPRFWKVSPLGEAGRLSIAKISKLMEEPYREVSAES